MKGSIEFEKYLPLTGEIVEKVSVDNVIMDNVLNSLAGLDRSFSNHRIVLGSSFNDDELVTTFNTMPGQIYVSNTGNTTFGYQSGNRHFTVECELNPLEGNGNIIAVGITAGGKLYNRAIFKRYGKLDDNETYEYKVVGILGSQIAPASNASMITTGISSDKNTNKITWQSNGVSSFYQVYRKSPGSLTFKLLTTTSRLFIYDDGFLTESSSTIPSPVGSIPMVNILPASTLSDPVPYAVEKTQEFAARVRVKIQF